MKELFVIHFFDYTVYMSILTAIFGSKKDKDLKHLNPIVEKVNSYESWAKGLKDEDFPLQTKRFKERLANGETLDQILPEAYALVREASFEFWASATTTSRSWVQ